MKSVANIFGGEGKVKILRLFIFNPNQTYTVSDVADRAKENLRTARREIRNLLSSGLIKKRSKGFILDQSYPYLRALSDFLVDASPLSEKDILKRVSRSGHLKLVLLSGVFIHDAESRVDLLVVGDHLKKKTLLSAVSAIEAELGKEVRYAAFETADFSYRLSMYDKLIRDILDFPHQKILNKLGV